MPLLPLVTGVLLPVVALACIVLMPWTNRPTQALILVVYFSYVLTAFVAHGVVG